MEQLKSLLGHEFKNFIDHGSILLARQYSMILRNVVHTYLIPIVACVHYCIV